jgi:hypothetical protein
VQFPQGGQETQAPILNHTDLVVAQAQPVDGTQRYTEVHRGWRGEGPWDKIWGDSYPTPCPEPLWLIETYSSPTPPPPPRPAPPVASAPPVQLGVAEQVL